MRMTSAPGLYFGWLPAGHGEDCKRPKWEVDTRVNFDAYRPRGHDRGRDHACANEDCSHRNQYAALTVRLVCGSCGVVRLFEGEEDGQSTMTTQAMGYGQKPRKVAGLWLYPGAPLLYGEKEPYDYLCAVEQADRLEPEHLVGYVASGRGPRGGLIWGAAALPVIDKNGRIDTVRDYKVRSGDLTFRKLTKAAEWVRAQVDSVQAATDGTEEGDGS